jgi:tetratricopeptide (TPR) repeat protein
MFFFRQKVFLLSGCFLAILALTARNLPSETREDEQNNLAIQGTVFLEAENRPAQGVMVTVKSLSNGPSVTVLTDDAGAFVVRGLTLGAYAVFTEESGYESTRVIVNSGDAPASLRLSLRARGSAPAGRARGSVSVHELQIPEKAQKEYRKGMECMAKGNAAGSVVHFQKAISAFPGFYEAYYSLGVAQMRLQLYSQAIEAFQKCIDSNGGKCALAEFAMGVALEHDHKFAEAESVLRRALEHDGNYAKGYLYLSVVLYDQDRLDEAERNAREVERRKPDLAPVYLVLANIHARQGNIQEEFRDLDKYLRLRPDEARPDARQAHENLQKRLAQEQALQEQ